MLRPSAVRLALAAALATLCPAAALAQSFVLLTQNMLRFGHGTRLRNQCNAITAASDTADIIVLQEVMTKNYPCLAGNNSKGVNIPVPSGFKYFTSSAKGQSSYKEYYGILARTNNVQTNVQISWLRQDDNLGATNSFMRPPYGVQFELSKQSGKRCSVWVVDFHAIFGKRRSGRQDEASAMQKVYNNLRGTKSSNDLVIVAGDWNLEASDARGFGWVKGKNARIEPDTLTSLTTAGVPSSAYDHVIYSANFTSRSKVTLANVRTYRGNYTKLDWRRYVSDHLGVMAKVTLQC
jgi:endonuclease/exonuclease/phosphatase family metal-dependent hydrolase